MTYLRDVSTGSAAISRTLTQTEPGQIVSVRLHLGAASSTSELLVVSIDSATAAAYDIVLASQDMNTLTDYVWAPNFPAPFFAGDDIKITWGNTNTVTYGLEIIWQDQ